MINYRNLWVYTLQPFLQLNGAGAAGTTLFVVNVHLSAGPAADRRLRQVHEALETVEKERCTILAEDFWYKIDTNWYKFDDNALQSGNFVELIFVKFDDN